MNRIKITLDNKEEIELYGNIPYENIKIVGDIIFYDIEISKKDYVRLTSKGVSVCKHYTSHCPTMFSGNLSNVDIQKIKDTYSVYYLHRRSKIDLSQKELFYSFLKKIVSNPSDINIIRETQEDINDQLIIYQLEIFDNNVLIRTERYENGTIISSDDVTSLIRDKRLNDLEI